MSNFTFGLFTLLLFVVPCIIGGLVGHKLKDDVKRARYRIYLGSLAAVISMFVIGGLIAAVVEIFNL
jgi:hypothetical protein